jgi:RHH-type rel operon transcriptional repressor/antitoxin RelB
MAMKEPASAGFFCLKKGVGTWPFPSTCNAHNGRYVQWQPRCGQGAGHHFNLTWAPGTWGVAPQPEGTWSVCYWRVANPLAKIRLPSRCKYECHYIEGRTMASINIRIDDELKVRAYQELEKLGVTPTKLMRQALQYVAERGQLPFRPVLMTEEDEALIATVRERLAAPSA